MTTPEKPLKLQPPKILFGNNYGVDQKCTVRLINETGKVLAYKMRAAKPAYYQMTNDHGYLEPGTPKELELVLKKGFPWEHKEVSLHKMTSMTLHPSDEDFQNQKPIDEVFKDGQPPCQAEVPLTLHPPAGMTYP